VFVMLHDRPEIAIKMLNDLTDGKFPCKEFTFANTHSHVSNIYLCIYPKFLFLLVAQEVMVSYFIIQPIVFMG